MEQDAAATWRRAVLGWAAALLVPFGSAAPAQELSLSPHELAIVLSLSSLGPPPPDPTNAVSGNCQAIDFGRNLFFDVRLSRDKNRSCASCHILEEGLADGRAVAIAPRVLRNTPSVWNVAYNRWFFWDGRADTAWAQAAGPIEAAAELNLDRGELARRVASEPDLRREYEGLFGRLPDLEQIASFSIPEAGWKPVRERLTRDDRDAVTTILVNVAKAIAAFEETLTSRDAAFDQFVRSIRAGAKTGPSALTAEALRGLKVFVGPGQCHHCHSGPNFSDGEFHNMLVFPEAGNAEDPGRARGLELLAASELRADGRFSSSPDLNIAAKLKSEPKGSSIGGQFKTPSLRNVAERTAFLHHGQIGTLEATVSRYTLLRAQVSADPRADPLVSSIEVSPRDVNDLVAFLNALTDTSRLETVWEDCADLPRPR